MQNMLNQRLDTINCRISDLRLTLDVLKSERHHIETQLVESQFEEDEVRRRKYVEEKGLKIENIKTFDLHDLPLSFLNKIVKKRYGVERLRFYSSSGGIKIETVTPFEYRQSVINQIMTLDSCSRCCSIYHKREECNVFGSKL